MSLPSEVNIVSFNIGQSGLPGTLRKIAHGRLDELVKQLSASVLCLQETKCSVVTLTEDQALARAYSSFFSSHKGGAQYAGVATIVRNDLHVLHVEEGLTGALLGLSAGSRGGPGAGVQTSASSWTTGGTGVDSASAAPRAAGLVENTPKGTGDVIPANDVTRVPTGRVFSPLELDYEGRCVIVEIAAAGTHTLPAASALSSSQLEQPHRLVIINTYCPALASEERAPYKWQYHEALARKAYSYYSLYGPENVTVVLCGDINIAHKKIDHADWQDWERRHGQTPYESGVFRRWMDGLMAGVHVLPDGSLSTPLTTVLPASAETQSNGQSIGCMYDPFRIRWPARASAFTCWSTLTGARATNYGTRLDYFLVDSSLCPNEHDNGRCSCSRPVRLHRCDILQAHPGSDHCPITLSVLLHPWHELGTGNAGGQAKEEAAPHPMSANALPQFKKRQSTVSSFFRKPVASDTTPSCTSSLSVDSTRGGLVTDAGDKTDRPGGMLAIGVSAAQPSQQAGNCDINDVVEILSSQEDGALGDEGGAGCGAGPVRTQDGSVSQHTVDAQARTSGSAAQAGSGSKKRKAADRPPPAGLSSWLVKRPVTASTSSSLRGVSLHSRESKGGVPGQPTAKQSETGTGDDIGEDTGDGSGASAVLSAALYSVSAQHSAANPFAGGQVCAGTVAKVTNTKAWAGLLAGPVPPPLCRCSVPMVSRTVLKDGPNKGKSFYVCARPEGKAGTAGARCDTFVWADAHRKAIAATAGTAST